MLINTYVTERIVMWSLICEVALDALIDSVKLLPFLFVTYLAMEYLEHKTSDKSNQLVERSGKFGPLYGSLLGIVPQCGFSAAATNLYAGRVITLGTLIAIYLSTSDEMLPILISEKVSILLILKILFVKVVIGMIAGFAIDFIHQKFLRFTHMKDPHHLPDIHHMCEHEHCHCDEKGIFPSALKHTLEIFVYILVISFVLNLVIAYIGEDTLSSFILNRPVIGELAAGLIGLIPNCAASVVITQLYLEGLLSAGPMMAGLLVSAGVGLLVLFKVNDHPRENLKILGLLYAIGVVSGLLIELFGITL